jgi:hypothetical protein
MQNYKKICDILGNEECKGFVNKFISHNPAQIAMQYRNKLPCDASVLALIIQLYQKATDKLPLWVQNYCALTTRSFEQATSQTAALYKATFIKGQKLLILGAGLGADEWAFSKTFHKVVSIEPDEELNEIVAFNYPRLEINNAQRVATTAEDYFYTLNEKFDCVYTDPDRRDEKGTRKITLQQSKPDIITLLPKIWECANTLVVKASPMIDIKATLAELGNVAEVRVIAIKNEVKEVLFTAKRNFEGKPIVIAANYDGDKGWQEYTAPDDNYHTPIQQPLASYFFEPNTAIIKAGVHQQYAAQLGLGAIDPKSAYYVGNTMPHEFMGRSFDIVCTLEFNKKKILAYLKDKKIDKANVAKRNFRLTADELKKLFKIKDGGNHYLFFTQQNGKGLLYHCLRK